MKILILIMTLLFQSAALACLHYPQNYNHKLQEGLQEIFLFHDGKQAHMFFRTQLSADKFPSEVSWVIPFPTLPTKYEQTERILFDEIKGYFQSDDAAFGIGRGLKAEGGGVQKGFKVHQTVNLENYTIQPIEILSEGSGNEFNEWLTKNKFNPMPFENQKYYLKKHAVFLAIRMKLNKPGAADLVSKPLHVVFKADKVSVPMKFTHDTRKFDLDIYVFSQKKLNKDLSAMYLYQKGQAKYEYKRETPFLDSYLKNLKKGYLTRYSAQELNHPEMQIKNIKNDPDFSKTELF